MLLIQQNTRVLNITSIFHREEWRYNFCSMTVNNSCGVKIRNIDGNWVTVSADVVTQFLMLLLRFTVDRFIHLSILVWIRKIRKIIDKLLFELKCISWWDLKSEFMRSAAWFYWEEDESHYWPVKIYFRQPVVRDRLFKGTIFSPKFSEVERRYTVLPQCQHWCWCSHLW